MDILEAHGRLALVPKSERCELLPDATEIDGIDYWPALCTAFALLSGALEDAKDLDQLKEAVLHGISLLSMDVIGPDDVDREGRAVIETVLKWGREAELCGNGFHD